MIALGSTDWTSNNPDISVSFSYEKRRSGADMQYRVQVMVSTVTGGSYFGYPIYMKLTIAGTLRETRTLKNASPSQWSSVITYTSDWYTVANKTTGTTPVSFNVYSGQGSSRSATYTYNMGVDPAASEISVSNGTLGTKLTLTLTRYNTSFTDTITYRCGTASGTVKSGSTSATVDWITANGNTVNLAAQNTTGQSVEVTFTVTTYSGSTRIGSNSKKVLMSIPSSVKPSVGLNITDAAHLLSVYDAYVQGHSRLVITASPNLAQNSPIKTYAITADGSTYYTNPVTTPALKGRGKLTITATATDARSRTSDPASQEITVLEYANPVVNLSAYRCNSSGTPDEEGAYMKIEVTSTISSLNGRNSATYEVVYSGGTLTGNGTSFVSDVLECDVSTSHSIEVTIQDDLSSTTKAAVIPIAFTLIDYYYTGKGIAFGKVGTKDGFECAMPADFTGGLSVGGKALLNLIYPVGSIYMSMNDVSPQTFFGGTWERLVNRFLIGAGSTYNVGAMDGYATHTLTVNELPEHRHDRIIYAGNGGWFVGDNTGLGGTHTATNIKSYNGYSNATTTTSASLWATNTTGGGAAHNNMPPYLAVYMWKRTK